MVSLLFHVIVRLVLHKKSNKLAGAILLQGETVMMRVKSTSIRLHCQYCALPLVSALTCQITLEAYDIRTMTVECIVSKRNSDNNNITSLIIMAMLKPQKFVLWMVVDEGVCVFHSVPTVLFFSISLWFVSASQVLGSEDCWGEYHYQHTCKQSE